MTKRQVQTVIDNLNKVLPMAQKDEQLDMEEARVTCLNYKCGTIHCLGGWYAIATLDTKRYLDYLDGAYKLAKDLGFINEEYLKIWTEDHHYLWGNIYGCFIFSDKSAFKSESRPGGANNLKDIINHFEEVRDRLIE